MIEVTAAVKWIATQSPKILTALIAAGLAILYLPDGWMEDLGLKSFRYEYRSYIGAIVVLAAALLLATWLTALAPQLRAAIQLVKTIIEKRRIRAAENRRLEELLEAPMIERAIFAWCLSNHRHEFRLPSQDPDVQRMIDKGFVVATSVGSGRNKLFKLESETRKLLERNRPNFRTSNPSDDAKKFGVMLATLSACWDRAERI